MFFQVYGEHAFAQWGMLIVVLLGLILLNEFARRTKLGGIITFFAIPVALTAYFIAIWVGARTGAQWALENQTHLYMQGWFHYAKLYAATAGCIGFMMIKYKWGIGAKHWFKPFPFVIVAINILIACASDFESAAMGWNKWWLTSEGVWQYGGWHNVMNGTAGLINIMCMTAWWNVYPSKDKKDMIWADMTWVYIVIYDIWNFAYTYNCLPTHSWYCGVALLLAPTVAAGSRTAPTPWPSGACSPRCSRSSRRPSRTVASGPAGQFCPYSIPRVWKPSSSSTKLQAAKQPLWGPPWILLSWLPTRR